ncbi:hypothetical protein QQM79_20920, partial [Marinobacteraceae bacterium S3BR75-40.1]
VMLWSQMLNKAIKHRRPLRGRLDLQNLAVFPAAYGSVISQGLCHFYSGWVHGPWRKNWGEAQLSFMAKAIKLRIQFGSQ